MIQSLAIKHDYDEGNTVFQVTISSGHSDSGLSDTLDEITPELVTPFDSENSCNCDDLPGNNTTSNDNEDGHTMFKLEINDNEIDLDQIENDGL